MKFLERIITMDETWVHLYDPETKVQSSVWKTPSSPSPKKARVSKSAGKVMFVVFFDIKGLILIHAVPPGTSVTGEYNAKVNKYQLINYF